VPRYVVLDHDHPAPHLDLMLQVGDVLWTWRLPDWPDEGITVEALRLGDHRLAYLDYEGPVSGGRGEVLRREGGEYEWLEQGEGRLVARLAGVQLRGRLTLARRDGDCWRVSFERE
jgi:hypothetical protein